MTLKRIALIGFSILLLFLIGVIILFTASPDQPDYRGLITDVAIYDEGMVLTVLDEWSEWSAEITVDNKTRIIKESGEKGTPADLIAGTFIDVTLRGDHKYYIADTISLFVGP